MMNDAALIGFQTKDVHTYLLNKKRNGCTSSRNNNMHLFLFIFLLITTTTTTTLVATASAPHAFSLRGSFVINEGSPLQSTIVLPMVNSSAPLPPYDDDISTVVISAKQASLSLEWRLDQYTAPVPYTIVATTGNAAVMSVPTLSLNHSGTLVSTAYAPLTVTFPCVTEGTSDISLTFILSHPTVTTMPPRQTTIFIRKSCLPPSCTGKCVSGTCGGASCTCDAGFGWAPFCDTGFWVDKTQVCPGERFTLSWAYLSNHTSAGNSGNDVVRLYYPLASSPFSTWTKDSLNTAVLVNADARLYASVKVASLSPGGAFVRTGNFSYQVFDESTPGAYAVSLWPASLATAAVSVTVKAKSDPSCLPSPTDCTCSGRGFCSAQWNCVCNAGFFGKKCEYGCAPETTLVNYGAAFSSSVDKSPYFLNNANCSWILQPSFVGATGITITIKRLVTEANFDLLRVYTGTTATPANLVTTVSGTSTEQTVTVVGATALVTFTSDSSFPSWPGVNEGFNASFVTTGCAAGNYIKFNSGTQTYTCTQCPSGYYSPVADSKACTPCSPGSYNGALGMTTCTPCSLGHHTAGANASTTCTPCVPGYYAENPGTASCTPCVKGTFSSTGGAVKCTNCDVTSFAHVAGSSQCFSCPRNTAAPFQRATALTDCGCSKGYYTFANRSGTECFPCPPGAVCNGGMLPPAAKNGYWFAPVEPLRMWECVVPSACGGGTAGSCARGHTSKMCSECADGFTKTARGDCVECSGSASLRVPIFITLFVIGAWFLLLVFMRQKVMDTIIKSTAQEKVVRRYQMPGLGSSFGIALTYVQIMGTFGKYTTRWPSSLGSTFAAFNILNLDTSVLFVQCSIPISYENFYALRIYLPFCLALVYVCLYILQYIHYAFVMVVRQPIKAHFASFYRRVEEHKNWEMRVARVKCIVVPLLGEELLERKKKVTNAVEPFDDGADEHVQKKLAAQSEVVGAGVNNDNDDDEGSDYEDGGSANNSIIRASMNRMQPVELFTITQGSESSQSLSIDIQQPPAVANPSSPSSLSPTPGAGAVLPSPQSLIKSPQHRRASSNNSNSSPRQFAEPSLSLPGEPTPVSSNRQHAFDFSLNRVASAVKRQQHRRRHNARSSSPSDTMHMDFPSMNENGGGGTSSTANTPMAATGRKYLMPTSSNVTPDNGSTDDGGGRMQRQSAASTDGEHLAVARQMTSNAALDAELSREPEISKWRKFLFLLFTEPIELTAESCVVAFIFFINIFYIYLVSSAVELFDCKDQPDGTASLVAYPVIDCYSSRWQGLLKHAVFAFIFYGIGCPAWIAYVLRNYKANEAQWMITWTFWHNFNYEAPFRGQIYYWALVLIARKLLISVAVVSITKDEGGKLVTAFLVIFLFLYLQVRRKPYKLVVHNLLEVRLSWLCLIILFGALVFTNEVLRDGVLYKVMTALCFWALLTAVVLVVLETFMFAYPRYKQYRKQRRGGQGCLDSLREAIQAV